MALNTSIRGLQIKDAFFGDGIKRNAGDGDIAELALKSSGGLKITSAELAIEPTDFAGDGLEDDGSDNLRLDLKSGGGLKIDTGEVAVEPDDFAGDGLADDGADNLKLDLNELTGAVVDVANDSIAIVDANDSNASRKEAVADLISAMAGTGLTATAGVLSVDTIADNLVEGDIQVENLSSEIDDSGYAGEHTLANTPIDNSVQIFLNGLMQEEGSGKDYTISGATFTFATQPESGDILIIHYIIDN